MVGYLSAFLAQNYSQPYPKDANMLPSGQVLSELKVKRLRLAMLARHAHSGMLFFGLSSMPENGL